MSPSKLLTSNPRSRLSIRIASSDAGVMECDSTLVSRLAKRSNKCPSVGARHEWQHALCTNWNYNSFSVHLLAKAYDVTQEPEYRDAALKKALLGVIPGQFDDGPRAGRWVDAHNARPAYHYIMLAALAQLAAIMPTEHPDRVAIIQSLKIGLKCRNSEILTQGVMTKDKAIECLLLVQSLFEQDANFLKETDSTSALEVLCRLASEQARRGRLPLGPRGWGEMLAMLAGRDP